MKALYHKDDDGRCAAAIVFREFGNENPFNPMTENDFIGYLHGDTIEYPEIKPEEMVYIVDVALSDEIVKFIHYVIDAGGFVMHIDHHKTGIDYWTNMSTTDPMYTSGHYQKFFKDGISGAMLTWIYSNMIDEEKHHAENVKFDFSEDWTHFMVGLATDDEDIDEDAIVHVVPCDGRNARERYIPPALRFINDHDVWTHALSQTKRFHAGFSSEKDKSPTSIVWGRLLYNNNPMYINAYLQKGDAILEYLESQYAALRENAFEYHFLANEKASGIRVLCINEPLGNSDIFGDLIKDYDAVCKYHFNGDCWRYTFYSHADSGTDVAALVRELGRINDSSTITCGGHKHAAGICAYKYLFTPIAVEL